MAAANQAVAGLVHCLDMLIRICAIAAFIAVTTSASPAHSAAQLVVPAGAGDRDARGAFAQLPGRRLWYLDTGGTGIPVVFLHAASGSSALWEHQIAVVRAAGYRFIAYDRLGSGRSVLDSRADPGSAADDLDALVSFLKIDRFHLVGTAAGGGVALDYALTHPERLRSLIVANSIGGVQDDEYLALSRRMRPAPQFDALPVEFRELGPSYRAANAEETARWAELARQSRPLSALTSPQRNRNRITFAMLETIRIPTLLLTGDADLYTPPPVLRLFAARINGAESLVVPEAGHSVYWERPQVFNAALLAFVARH